MTEEKKEKKALIKPLVITAEKDEKGHAILKTADEDDAAILGRALNNPKGVMVKVPEEKTCPAEPEKKYKDSVCYKINKAFEKAKKESEAE